MAIRKWVVCWPLSEIRPVNELMGLFEKKNVSSASPLKSYALIRERNETYRRANEDLMEELLPVMDHMELALDAAAQHEADEAMVEGFRMVSEQLRGALAKFGLTPIDAAAAEFDPNLHEAISHLP